MSDYLWAPEAVNVQDYAGREAGKPGWVLASGPSLLHQPPGEMIGGVIIATNQNVNAHKRLGMPRADYWVFGDLVVAQLWKAGKLDVHPETQKWSANLATAFLLGWGKRPADLAAGERGTGDNFVNWLPNQGSMLSKQLPNLWCCRRTTTAAVSLAWVLGCNPIHVRGVDHKQDDSGRLHWWDAPGDGNTHPDRKTYLGSYEHSRETLRLLLDTIRADGVTVTVESDKSLLEIREVPCP